MLAFTLLGNSAIIKNRLCVCVCLLAAGVIHKTSMLSLKSALPGSPLDPHTN